MTRFSTDSRQEELERLRREVAELRDVETRLRQEIEERERVENSLSASETRFRTLIEQSPFSIIIYDKDGRILMANPTSIELWRLSPEHFSYLLANYNILEDQALAKTGYLDVIKRAFAGEAVVIPPTAHDLREYPYQEASPQKLWVATHAYPIKDEAGQVQEVAIMHEDVSERIQTEIDLRQSEALHRTLVQTIPYGVQEVDKDGRIIYTNPAFCATMGYTNEELIGRYVWDLTAEETEQRRLKETMHYLHEFNPEPETYISAAQTKDGRIIQTQVDWDYRRDPDGAVTGTIAILTDITARKQAEERLENYAHRLEIVHQVAQAILAAESPQAVAYAVLARIREALPFSRSSVVLFDFSNNEGFVLASFDRQETGVRTGITRPLNEFDIDAGLFAGEYMVRDNLNETLPALVQRLKEEGVHSYLGFPLMVQGQLIGALYLAAKDVALFSAYYIETIREIADFLSIAIQQARLHEQVQQHSDDLERRVTMRTRDLTEANEKLKEMDRLKSKFISDISHELRTPVTNLSLYLDLMESGKPERLGHYQTVLREQTERLKTLVQGTLDLSRLDIRQDETALSTQPLNPVVEQAAAAFRDLAQERELRFDVSAAPDLPDVLINAEQIGRAVASLLQNAIQYTPSGRVLARTFWDETAVSVAIQVQDTGMGLDEDDLAHCFEPFYRGLRIGQLNMPGNGLGLALAHKIVAQHNGRIVVESVVHEGSVFTIWLPSAAALAADGQ